MISQILPRFFHNFWGIIYIAINKPPALLCFCLPFNYFFFSFHQFWRFSNIQHSNNCSTDLTRLLPLLLLLLLWWRHTYLLSTTITRLRHDWWRNMMASKNSHSFQSLYAHVTSIMIIISFRASASVSVLSFYILIFRRFLLWFIVADPTQSCVVSKLNFVVFVVDTFNCVDL